MVNFSGMDAVAALVKYVVKRGGSFPEYIYNKLIDTIASPDGMGTMDACLEGLYAISDELDLEGRELLRDLSRFFAEKNFLGKGARASEINTVMERVLAGGAAIEEGDPEVDPAYVAPVVPEAPEPEEPVQPGG